MVALVRVLKSLEECAVESGADLGSAVPSGPRLVDETLGYAQTAFSCGSAGKMGGLGPALLLAFDLAPPQRFHDQAASLDRLEGVVVHASCVPHHGKNPAFVSALVRLKDALLSPVFQTLHNARMVSVHRSSNAPSCN